MAKKSLSERIAERAKREEQPTRAAQNRAQFLAQRDEIRKALEDGWPMKAAWRTLHAEGAVTFGYDAFVRYVKKDTAAPIGRKEQERRPPTGEGQGKIDKERDLRFTAKPDRRSLIGD